MTEFKPGDMVSLKNNVLYVHRAFPGMLYVGSKPTATGGYSFPIPPDAVERHYISFQGNDYEWYNWEDFEAKQCAKLEDDNNA